MSTPTSTQEAMAVAVDRLPLAKPRCFIDKKRVSYKHINRAACGAALREWTEAAQAQSSFDGNARILQSGVHARFIRRPGARGYSQFSVRVPTETGLSTVIRGVKGIVEALSGLDARAGPTKGNALVVAQTPKELAAAPRTKDPTAAPGVMAVLAVAKHAKKAKKKASASNALVVVETPSALVVAKEPNALVVAEERNALVVAQEPNALVVAEDRALVVAEEERAQEEASASAARADARAAARVAAREAARVEETEDEMVAESTFQVCWEAIEHSQWNADGDASYVRMLKKINDLRAVGVTNRLDANMRSIVRLTSAILASAHVESLGICSFSGLVAWWADQTKVANPPHPRKRVTVAKTIAAATLLAGLIQWVPRVPLDDDVDVAKLYQTRKQLKLFSNVRWVLTQLRTYADAPSTKPPA